MPEGTGGSTLLVDEYYKSGDSRFLGELFASRSERKLKSFAETWYADQRDFARETLLSYIDDGCDRWNHRALVKSLFKQAEAASDDEAMAHFLVAFDRLVKHDIIQKWEYNWQTRERTSRYITVPDPTVPSRAAKSGNQYTSDRFSRRTRIYLCRRVFRYFRKIAFKDPERYGRVIRQTLSLYKDEHLEKPQQLIDSWSLMHVLYWGAPVIQRKAHGVRLAAGARLGDLKPCPFFPAAWQNAFHEILHLVLHAQSRTVRVWASTLLKRDYDQQIRGIEVQKIRTMLSSIHEEAQELGAEMLKHAEGLPNVTVSEWLELLNNNNLSILPVICELMMEHVHPERVTLEQCVDLAQARVAAVAELGLNWARSKPVRDEDTLRALLRLCNASVATVRSAAVEWIKSVLRQSTFLKSELVLDLADSAYAETRAAGLSLMAEFYPEDTSLWAALAESPYPDVRSWLVLHLKMLQKVLHLETVQGVWTSSLLAIHSGSKAKRVVIRQITERIIQNADSADSLLPLLGVMLRSVRPPERRNALAALARCAFESPGLQSAIERRLPELKLFAEVS